MGAPFNDRPCSRSRLPTTQFFSPRAINSRRTSRCSLPNGFVVRLVNGVVPTIKFASFGLRRSNNYPDVGEAVKNEKSSLSTEIFILYYCWILLWDKAARRFCESIEERTALSIHWLLAISDQWVEYFLIFFIDRVIFSILEFVCRIKELDYFTRAPGRGKHY